MRAGPDTWGTGGPRRSYFEGVGVGVGVGVVVGVAVDDGLSVGVAVTDGLEVGFPEAAADGEELGGGDEVALAPSQVLNGQLTERKYG